MHIPNLLHFYSIASYKACLKQGVVYHVNTCNKLVTYVKFSWPLFCKKFIFSVNLLVNIRLNCFYTMA